MKRFGRFASRRLLVQRARKRFGRFVRVGIYVLLSMRKGGSRSEDERAG